MMRWALIPSWAKDEKIGEFIFDNNPENRPAWQIIQSFSTITTPANPMVAAVH